MDAALEVGGRPRGLRVKPSPRDRIPCVVASSFSRACSSPPSRRHACRPTRRLRPAGRPAPAALTDPTAASASASSASAARPRSRRSFATRRSLSRFRASATVGPLGGTLSLPGAGLLVVVPPLALSSRQTITVTAVAGSNVAYEFAPHGLKFNLPLVVTQNLGVTQAGANGLVNPLSLFARLLPRLDQADVDHGIAERQRQPVEPGRDVHGLALLGVHPGERTRLVDLDALGER